MNFDWQTIGALICVLAAGIAVGMRVRGWIVGTRQAACGAGCGNCPAGKAKPLVEITSITSLIGPPTKK